MYDEDITQEDIESTYKVLEQIRDEWGMDSREKEISNEAHCIVQEFELDMNN